jgi:beta-glucosidase
VVEAVSAGNWIKFADAALGRGATHFTGSAAKASSGGGTVQIRLDSPTGRLVGTATVASTGDVYSYTPISTDLRGVTGRHDVYLVLDAGIRLATFSLT